MQEIPQPQKGNIEDWTDAFLAVREIIRRSIVTMLTMKDPDQKFRRAYAAAWSLPVVHDVNMAYGYGAASVSRFQPSPQDISQMEQVAPWLVWIRQREGDQALRRMFGWAMGAPLWTIGQRERCSDRTIKNRIDRSVAAIIRQFAQADLSVEILEEGERPAVDAISDRSGRPQSPFGLMFTKPEGPHGAVKLAKVYVHDVGYVIGTKRWRDGREKIGRVA